MGVVPGLGFDERSYESASWLFYLIAIYIYSFVKKEHLGKVNNPEKVLGESLVLIQ